MTRRTRDVRLSVRGWLLVAAGVALPVAAAGRSAAPLHAGDHGGHGAKQGEPKASAGLLVDLGNTKCPIMGGKPDGSTWSEWNGLRIGHCCGMCTAKFAAAPERSLKQANIEWKEAAAAVKKVNEAKGADRAKALEELKKKWTVVREPVLKILGTLVDLANAKCPVKSDAVDGKTWSEWSGLRVGHCCPGCSETFLASPEKLLAAAEIEWKSAADAVKAVDAAKGAARSKALAELKKKWTVVREPAPEEAKK